MTSNVKLKSSIQLRKGKKILAKGSISGKTTTLKLKKTTGKLTTALLWTLGKKKLTVTTAAPLARSPRRSSAAGQVLTVAASRRPRRCSSISSPKAALSVAGVSAVAIGPCATLAPSRMRSACVAQAGMSSTWCTTVTVASSRLVGRQPLERADHGLAARQVEARGGLVEQEQRRLVHERARDQHAPALALRERAEALLLAPRAAEALEQDAARAPGRRR